MKAIKGSVLFFFLCSFTLFPASVRVIAPNGGENLELGSSIAITWDAEGLSNPLTITLWQNDSRVGVIARSVANSARALPWIVGRVESGESFHGRNFKIRVREQGERVGDESDGVFSITLARLGPSSVSRLRVRSDYAVESLEFEDAAGQLLVKDRGRFLLPYSGREIRATAIVRVKWNRAAPENPGAVRCDTYLAGEQRYLADRPDRSVSIGTMLAGFNRSGNGTVRFPMTIRAGEKIGSEINVQVRFLPMEDGCDSTHINNSRGENLRLGQRLLSVIDPDRIRCDLEVTAAKSDLEVMRRYTLVPCLEPGHLEYRVICTMYVRNILRLPDGDPPPPLNYVILRHTVQYQKADGSWYPEIGHGASGQKSILNVGVNRVETRFDQRFCLPPNYWGDVRLILEIDPHHEHQDVDKSNNTVVLLFKVM